MAIRAFKVGFATTDTPGDIVGLRTDLGAGGLSYDTLKQGAANYQVPAAKTLYITRLSYWVATSGGAIIIGYGDTAVSQSGSAPTNAVILAGGTIAGGNTAGFHGTVAGEQHDIDVFITVPTGKYPFAFMNGNVSVNVFGLVI